MRRTVWLLIGGLALLPCEGAAQPATSGDRGSLDALVREVRLLRQAVERQTANVAKTQLLASRLALQHERVVRAQDAVDRLNEALEDATASQEELRETLVRVNSELAPVLHDPRRSELERQVASVRAQLTARDREVTRLTAQRAPAEQKLTLEQRVFRELESALGSLER